MVIPAKPGIHCYSKVYTCVDGVDRFIIHGVLITDFLFSIVCIYVVTLFMLNTKPHVFTMRHYVSAVLAVIVCLCIRLSVCHKLVLYQNGYK